MRGALWCSAISGVLLLFLVCLAAPAAAEPVGWVQEARGVVTILSQGQSSPAQVGTGVKAQDSLRTGAASRVQIMFKDKTTLALGENSECALGAIVLDQGKPQGANLPLTLLKGAMGILLGAVGKSNPAGFTVETPQVSVGVRGTEFGSVLRGDAELHGLQSGGPVLVRATALQSAAAAPKASGAPPAREALCKQLKETVRRFELAAMAVRGTPEQASGKELKAKVEEYEAMQRQHGCE